MDQWKYVYHTHCDDNHPAERELYDLQADPNELHNLAMTNRRISSEWPIYIRLWLTSSVKNRMQLSNDIDKRWPQADMIAKRNQWIIKCYLIAKSVFCSFIKKIDLGVVDKG